MYWNIAGMAVCLIAARYLKCKVCGSQKAYKASLILAAAFLLAAASAWTEQTEGEEKKIVRSEPGEGIQEKEFAEVESVSSGCTYAPELRLISSVVSFTYREYRCHTNREAIAPSCGCRGCHCDNHSYKQKSKNGYFHNILLFR